MDAMLTEGMIYLYHRDGECVAFGRYTFKKERQRIIERWAKLYAASFYHCYIHIAPNVEPHKVKKNGENYAEIGRRTLAKNRPQPLPPIVRPPTINSTPYNIPPPYIYD